MPKKRRIKVTEFSPFRYEKVRFVLVGVANTTVDFGILLTLSLVVGLPVLLANTFSTGIALTVSYALNKRAVFGDKHAPSLRQVVTFVVVTLIGLWIVQNIIIALVFIPFSQTVGSDFQAPLLIAAKLMASAVTMVWNYVLYQKIVFNRQEK
jgi:putative flippase GtrA